MHGGAGSGRRASASASVPPLSREWQQPLRNVSQLSSRARRAIQLQSMGMCVLESFGSRVECAVGGERFTSLSFQSSCLATLLC